MPVIVFSVTVAITAQAFLRNQLTTFVDRGWEVHLICSPEDGTDSYSKLQQLPGVHIHPVQMLRNPHPLRDLRSFLKLLKLLKQLKPQVVVASTPKAGLLTTLAARFAGVPSRIYHMRGLRAQGLNGIMRKVSLLAERISILSATLVLVDSFSLLVELRRHRLLQADAGVVLGEGSSCGVDTDYFRPPTNEERSTARGNLGFGEDDIVVGFLGRLSVDKGIRELVAAMKEARIVNPRIKLALVGPIEGTHEISGILELGEEVPWIVYPGSTTDPRSSYWAFDIFCLPSYREGFPIAPLEAQASFLPVVTTQATGCVDSIVPGLSGLIVPIKDYLSLKDAILTLASDDKLCDQFARAGRERIIDSFSQEYVTENVFNFIVGSSPKN